MARLSFGVKTDKPLKLKNLSQMVNNQDINVVFFPAKSEKGLELIPKLEELFSNKEVVFYVGNRFEEEINQDLFSHACLKMDLIIFDATREEDSNNFDIANELMKHLPYVVIISRNYLPVNLFSIIKGGYPDYTTKELTNKEIVSFLKKNIDSLLLKRSEEEKKIENQAKIIQNEVKKFRENKIQETNVFISFRTKYENRTNSNFPKKFKHSVGELANRIKEGEYHPSRKSAQYLNNGALVYDNELLTEHRRWQLLSIIDNDLIINCDEFWIYGSKDYLDSWWTQGELVVFAYVLQSGVDTKPFNNNKILKLYDPTNDTVQIIPKENHPKLSKEQIKKISRFYTNTSPNQMGVESVKINNSIKKLGFLFRNPLTKWFIKPRMKKVFKKQMEMYEHLNIPFSEKDLDFETWYQTYFSKKYLNSHAFSKKFWNQLEMILLKEDKTKSAARYSKLKNLEIDLNIDHFLSFEEFDRYPIDDSDLESGFFKIRNNTYELKQEYPRFYFSPTKFNTDLSSTGQNLEFVPTYRFFKKVKNHSPK